MKDYHIINGYSESIIQLICNNFSFNVRDFLIITQNVYLIFKSYLKDLEYIFCNLEVEYVVVSQNRLILSIKKNYNIAVMKTILCLTIERIELDNNRSINFTNVKGMYEQYRDKIYNLYKENIESIEEKINQYCNNIIYYHGGDIRIIDVDNNDKIIYFLIIGSCASCNSNINYIKNAVIKIVSMDDIFCKYKIYFK